MSFDCFMLVDRGQNDLEILKETGLIRAIDSVPKSFFYDVLESYIHDFVNMEYTEKKDRKVRFFY